MVTAQVKVEWMDSTIRGSFFTRSELQQWGLTAIIHQTKMRLRQSSPATLCSRFKYSCSCLYFMHHRPCLIALYVLCNVWGTLLWFNAFYVAAGGTCWRRVWKWAGLKDFFHSPNVLKMLRFPPVSPKQLYMYFFPLIYLHLFCIHFSVPVLTLCFSKMFFKHLPFTIW